MSGQRRKPFSGKKKKEQLKLKKLRDKPKLGDYSREAPVIVEEEKTEIPAIIWTSGPQRLQTIFYKESKATVAEKKKDATRPLQYANKYNTSPYDSGIGKPENELEMPKRPKWNNKMTPEELETQERDMFRQYIEDVYTRYDAKMLNYFEHNLEVWRQLWRTIEKSDILLFLVDGRFPILNFNRSLYQHVTEDHKKDIVLCVNKCDLVPKEIQEQWKQYLQKNFPKLKIVFFQKGLPRSILLKACSTCLIERRGKKVSAAPFFTDLLDADMKEAPQDIEPKVVVSDFDEDKEGDEEVPLDESPTISGQDHESKQPRENYVVIGVIGEPNMGKSTTINCIFKKVVVSHSATPGHTKHFQTLFLSPKVNFCDCPGVVFPKLAVPKEIQVLFGSFRIAQTQEPYSAIRYLAERCVPRLDEAYGLQPFEVDESDMVGFEWSPYHICESYAHKRGFHTKGGKVDVYRAANQILRHALGGEKVSLFFPPPGSDYFVNECKVETTRSVKSLALSPHAKLLENQKKVGDGSEEVVVDDDDDGYEEEENDGSPKSSKFSCLLNLSNSSDDDSDDE